VGVVCFGGSGVFSVLGSLAVKQSERSRIVAPDEQGPQKLGRNYHGSRWLVVQCYCKEAGCA